VDSSTQPKPTVVATTTKPSEATVPDVMYAIATTSVLEPATGTITSTRGITNVSDAHYGASLDAIATDSVVKAPNKLLS